MTLEKGFRFRRIADTPKSDISSPSLPRIAALPSHPLRLASAVKPRRPPSKALGRPGSKVGGGGVPAVLKAGRTWTRPSEPENVPSTPQVGSEFRVLGFRAVPSTSTSTREPRATRRLRAITANRRSNLVTASPYVFAISLTGCRASSRDAKRGFNWLNPKR